MKLRLLGLLLIFGCATSPDPGPEPDAPTDREVSNEARDGVCERYSAVTVHVDNRSSMDVQIAFGPYAAARAAPGFTRTTYTVPRSYLDGYIRLRILRGGLQMTRPPPVPTEHVICNDATLIIGSRPSYSFFYGDKLAEGFFGDKDEEDASESNR